MPKIKTRKSAAKRFTKTGSGKIKFRKAFSSHIMTKKSTKRKRSLRVGQLLDATNVKSVKRMLPNG